MAEWKWQQEEQEVKFGTVEVLNVLEYCCVIEIPKMESNEDLVREGMNGNEAHSSRVLLVQI